MKESPTRSKSLEQATADFWEAWESRNKLDMKKKLQVFKFLRTNHGVEKERLINWMMKEFMIERDIARNMVVALKNENMILEVEDYYFPAGD